MTEKWKSKLTISYVPCPPDKEEAYWAAMDLFAQWLFADRIEHGKEDDEKVSVGDEDVLLVKSSSSEVV